MKQDIKYSPYSIILTVVALVLFVIGIYAIRDNTAKLNFFCALIGIVTMSGLYYCPMSVDASQSELRLNRLLSRPRTFSYGQIQSVDTCYPSGSGLRLLGTGGFFGYWGYFSDIMIGTYFGYYGSRSHCFVVRLKSGKQYVIGCENAFDMVKYIKSQIENPHH